MKAPTRPIPGSIATKGKDAAASDKPTHRASPPLPVRKKAVPVETKDVEGALGFLNFRVPAELKREFKTYAASHDMKMNELLRRSFRAYRKQRGD